MLEQKSWIGYEVVLDVFPDVFLWGDLLLPKDLKPGEKRPVVVCQHGVEGVPADVINEDPKSQAFAVYKDFAGRLAERGFVVFAPITITAAGIASASAAAASLPAQENAFRRGGRPARAAARWLGQQSFVDGGRIGFYGLSYGGFSAKRVGRCYPATLSSSTRASSTTWPGRSRASSMATVTRSIAPTRSTNETGRTSTTATWLA